MDPSARERTLTSPDAVDSARSQAEAPSQPELPSLAALMARLEEAEETLRAIRTGEVDAVVVNGPDGPRTYTLVSADQSYRMLVEQMSEGALTLNHEGTILYSNGRLGPMLGLPRGNLVGHSLTAFVCDAQRPGFQVLFERAREEEVGGEFRLCGADGREVPVQLSFSPLLSGPFRGICLVATDLSEQKQREQAIAEERLTEAILEYAATAILFCDDEGTILRANGRAGETCGPRLIGRMFDELFTGGAFALLKESFHQDADLRHDLKHLRPGAAAVGFLGGARPIRGDTPEPRWVVTLTDITRRQELEAERVQLLEAERAARAEAELANQAKTKFLAVMSHELRTPLTAVIGYSDLLREGVGGPLVPAQREYIARIKASAWHLLGLIEEILTFARIDAGRESASLRVIDLTTVAREAAAFIETQAREKGLELRVSLPIEPAITASDAGKLRQVVLNLLGNAVKFTQEGFVEFALEPFEGGFRFRVCDSGPGIAPPDIDRIFEPFTQLDQTTTRITGGTGLGLTIARQLAGLLGGRIEVQSTLGEGSCFSLVLPAREGEA